MPTAPVVASWKPLETDAVLRVGIDGGPLSVAWSCPARGEWAAGAGVAAEGEAPIVWENGELINSASMGTFLLERYAPAHTYPKMFGITRVIARPESDLGFYFDYEVASGLDQAAAEVVTNGVAAALPRKRYPQFYVSDVYRFLYAEGFFAAVRGQGDPASSSTTASMAFA